MAHLRDGLVRAVQARLKAARNSKSLPAGEDERVGKALQAFKALFPARSIAKGSSLTLHRNRAGVLRVEHDGVDLGHVDDPWLSRELFIAYFADKDVISVKVSQRIGSRGSSPVERGRRTKRQSNSLKAWNRGVDVDSTALLYIMLKYTAASDCIEQIAQPLLPKVLCLYITTHSLLASFRVGRLGARFPRAPFALNSVRRCMAPLCPCAAAL